MMAVEHIAAYYWAKYMRAADRLARREYAECYCSYKDMAE